MLTVNILINGQPLFARSCRNSGETDEVGYCKYITDAGEVVYHEKSDGAVELAKLLLDTIDVKMETENRLRDLLKQHN